MKCNKCGTPIIPGEDTCRICGNKTDFSKRGKEPEIIDFPDDIKEEVSIVLPDLNNIINSNDTEINTVSENDLVTSESDEEKQIIQSKEEPIDISKEELVEEQELEEPKSKKKKVLDKANSKEEPKKNKSTDKTERKSNNIGIILLIIVLLCSLVGNIYLLVMNGNAKAAEKTESSQEEIVYSKISYENYKMTIPSTWITENDSKALMVYDETQNWSARMQIIANANYDSFVTNKDTLVESLGSLKYQFTSNYSKKVENQNYYLFKGKYYNYSVYVIVTEIDDSNILVTDLKFKGEVDDILLNNILTVMSTIKINDTEELFKDNFEFQDISNQISSISQNKE